MCLISLKYSEVQIEVKEQGPIKVILIESSAVCLKREALSVNVISELLCEGDRVN